MVFKRRDRVPFWHRIREVMAPRKGWRRGYVYIGKRVQRLPDSPHRIALGFACGVQASFTPFFGFHFVIAALLALVTRGNVIASLLGTFVGNPATFPFIAGASFFMGTLITGNEVTTPEHIGIGWLWDNLDAIFVPYLIGGLLPGLVSSTICYFVLRPIVAAYQNRRRTQLMDAAKARVHAHAEKFKSKRAAKAAGKAAKAEESGKAKGAA